MFIYNDDDSDVKLHIAFNQIKCYEEQNTKYVLIIIIIVIKLLAKYRIKYMVRKLDLVLLYSTF